MAISSIKLWWSMNVSPSRHVRSLPSTMNFHLPSFRLKLSQSFPLPHLMAPNEEAPISTVHLPKKSRRSRTKMRPSDIETRSERKKKKLEEDLKFLENEKNRLDKELVTVQTTNKCRAE